MDDPEIRLSTLAEILHSMRYGDLVSRGEQYLVEYLAKQDEIVREPVSMYVVHQCLCGAGSVSIFVLDAVQPLIWAIDGYRRMRCDDVASLLLGSFLLARRLNPDFAYPAVLPERFQDSDGATTLVASFDDVDGLYFSRIANLKVDGNAPGWEVAPKAIDKIVSLYLSCWRLRESLN